MTKYGDAAFLIWQDCPCFDLFSIRQLISSSLQISEGTMWEFQLSFAAHNLKKVGSKMSVEEPKNKIKTVWLLSDFDLVEDAGNRDGLSVGTPCSIGEVKFLESPMSDGTIEEDFEAALAREVASNDGNLGQTRGPLTLSQGIDDEDFSAIARHGIVEVVGDDVAGRKIIVISACRLPSNKNFDHQKFLR